MARFKRLTDAEARQLTRAELLDRIEREQAYWHRKPAASMTEADRAAEREFTRIMFAYIDPGAAMQSTIDQLEGRGTGGYWESRPADDGPVLPPALAMDDNQRAGLDYARRLLAREAAEREAGQ